MTFDPNDPRLTAYALGELDSSERESVENLLKESGEARQAVEEIRLTIGWLARELHHERETYSQQPSLNHQPLAVSVAKPLRAPRSWWSRNAFRLGSLAALLLLTVGLTRRWFAPRFEPAAAPNRVAAGKARGVAGEVAPKARILAEGAPAKVDSYAVRAPTVFNAAGSRPEQAAVALRSGTGLARAAFAPRSVRRRSVVEASAAIEVAFVAPGANRESRLAVTSPAGGDRYFALDVTQKARPGFEALQYRQPDQASQGQGMGGGAGMMNSRGLQQNRQAVSGPQAAKEMGPAQTPQGAAAGRRQNDARKAAALGGAQALANKPSRGSVSPQRVPELATGGMSGMRTGKAPSQAVADNVDKLQNPAQIEEREQADLIPQSRAKSTFAYESQQTRTPAGNTFRSVRETPRSTFLIDVDRASYASVRRALSQNALPPKDAVRIEELLNEFPYHDAAPSRSSAGPFALHVEIAGCPWDQRHRLARIGITARPVDQSNRPACNLVFLIDVSPSMQQPDRLPLVQWSLEKLIDQLGDRDRLAIVAFGRTPGIVLASTSATAKSMIRAAVDDLRVEAQGARRSALALAYEIAGRSFLDQGTNRVILVTDDSSKIGAMGQDDLIGLVAAKASSGVSLSVLGVGAGTVDDNTIATLADKGRGHHAHIGSPLQAYRVLVVEMGSRLATIATDAKVQVEFNASQASAYRLIGYHGATVPPAASIDDSRDAGAIVEGHHVTALYEVVPPDVPNLAKRSTEELRESLEQRLGTLTVRLSYKKPDEGRSRLIEQTGIDRGTSFERASNDLKLAAAVAGFGMLLSESPFSGSASYDAMQQIIQPFLAEGSDPTGCYHEFAELIGKAKLSRRERDRRR